MASEPNGGEGRGWSFVGAPLDCSGTGRGERRAVTALREAGIVEELGAAARGSDAQLREEDLVDERIHLVEGRRISRGDPSRLGAYVAERLAAQPGRFWVHFDVDVFDERELPSVTYPQPEGLDWQEVAALLRPLVSSPAIVGLSVADFDPDNDSDGEYARRLVALLADVLQSPR